MSQADLKAGDILVFQIEAAFVLTRVLAIDGEGADRIWHVAAFADMFPDLESAEEAASSPGGLNVDREHIALTDRAFESTQVARIGHSPITETEHSVVSMWRSSPDRQVFDRSVRLVLGLR